MTTVPLEVVPDPDDADAAQVWWEVDVAGVPQRMLLDTGASRTTVAPHPGLRSATDPAPAGRGLSGLTGDGTLATVPRLAIGGRELATDLVVDVVPTGSARPPLLGADALQGHRLHLRFSAAECVLDGTRPDGFLLELERPGAQPFVEVRGEGLHTRACLDTGAGVTIVDLAFARAHPAVFTLAGDAVDGADASGHPVPGVAATMAAVRIGGATFPAQRVVAVDLSRTNEGAEWPLTLILGLPLIAAADWYLDFPGNAWGITRRPA